MALNGVTTSNLDPISLPTSVVGEDASGTGLIPLDILSLALSGVGPLATALSAVMLAIQADMIWSLRSQMEATSAGDGVIALVLLDPVLANRGIWERESGAWVRKSDLPADAAAIARDAALLAQTASEAARDLAAGYASDAVSQGNVPIYGTFTGLPGLNIPAGISGIIVNGRSTAGGGGRAFCRKVAAGPANAGRIQSGDGAWWEIADTIDVAMLGGKDDNGTPCTAAVSAAVSLLPSGGTIRFPRQSATGIYLFDGGIPPVAGLWFDVEEGVTLKGSFSRPQSPGQVPGAANHPRFRRRTKVYDTSTDAEMWFYPDYRAHLAEKDDWIGEGDLSRSAISLAAADTVLKHMSIAWPAGETWQAEAPVATTGTVQWPAATDNRIYASLLETKWAEQMDVAFTQDTAEYLRAAVIRVVGGHYFFYGARGGNAINWGFKADGAAAVTGAFTIPGGATQISQQPHRLMWGIQVINPKAFALLVNGVRVRVVRTSTIITHFGFGRYNADVAVTIQGFRLVKSKQFFGGGDVRMFCTGDSMTADWYGAWPHFSRLMIDGSNGLRVTSLVNRAVGGWTSQHVLNDLNGTDRTYWDGQGIAFPDLTTFNVACLMVGPNDVAPSTDWLTLQNRISASIDILQAAGLAVVVAPFPLWYSKALGGGSGQDLVNYEIAAQHRVGIQQLIATKGCYEADINSSEGHVLAAYKGSDPETYDQVRRDNIHQTAGSNKLMARSFARSIIHALCPETTRKTGRTLLPAAMAAGGFTLSGSSSFSSNEIGDINLRAGVTMASQTLNNTLIGTLPASLKPAQTTVLSGDGGSTGVNVRVILGTDGTITAWSSAAVSVLNFWGVYARE